MRTFSWIIAIAVIAGISGCTPSQSGNTASRADASAGGVGVEAFREMLRSKAEDIAERDLARMMAAELLYRNVAEYFEPIHRGRQMSVPLWVKQYRHYRSYEIADIYRSDSYLYPIVYEIHYLYDYLHTARREILQTPNAKEVAMKDQDFRISQSGALIRRYRCDADGNYIGDLPEFPPRPTFEFYPTGRRIPERNEGIPNPIPPR
jgi:hypothetical protein